MAEIYFDIPFYKRLTSCDGWDRKDKSGTHYHVARAFFRMNSRHHSGSASIGKKFDVLGKPEGMTQERIKTIEIETDVFQQTETIEKSIVETECMTKVLDELAGQFGDGKLFKVGGKINQEQSARIKAVFDSEFKITTSSRKRKLIKYEFKDAVPQDFKDRVCGVEMYQKSVAILYLIRIDFLNVKYERTFWGLRKKIKKYPFPVDGKAKHPNIINIGVPVAVVEYWSLLPESSLIIKDSDYRPEVLDDAEIIISTPDNTIKDRPYWSVPDTPSLYQLANVAFPVKWVKLKGLNYTKEELIEMELGEAEETAWWFTHGPGRNPA